MQYSEKVLDHFTHPRNVGEIEDANGVGEVGNAKCGDIMKIYLKVSDEASSRMLSLRPSAAARQSQPARWLPRW